MRGSIKQDLKFTGEIILDELYLGGNIKEYLAKVKMPTIGIIGDNSYFGCVSVTLRFILIC